MDSKKRYYPMIAVATGCAFFIGAGLVADARPERGLVVALSAVGFVVMMAGAALAGEGSK